ncbi:MAG TPA: hypothetical protein VGC15_20570 [Acetobacteraceae bacterium]
MNPKPPAPASWFIFQDNSIGYRFGTEFKEPAIRDPKNPSGTPISKSIVTLSHVDAWRYGANFVNLDILKSDHADPANKTSTGAVELYLIYRGQLSPDEIFRTKLFPAGPIRDITFEAGFDHNTKNTQFASYKWLAVAGPNIHFNVPGFLNIGLHYAQEWNHNGIVGRNIQFDPTFEVEAVYQFPLGFTKLPLRLEGFANLVTPKGRDAFGSQTEVEILSQTRLTLDIGKVLLQRAEFLDFSVGFQYWFNKFGNDHTRVKGSIENAPFFATRVHF